MHWQIQRDGDCRNSSVSSSSSPGDNVRFVVVGWRLEVEGVKVEERDGAQPEGLEGVETVSCTCRIRPSAPINLGATRAQFSDLRARTRS